jgi:hypothetical protein
MSFSPRHLRFVGSREVRGLHVKRYHVSVDGERIAADIVAAADAFLPELLPAADQAHNRAAFSVLHRGEDAVWLLLYTWVWDVIVHCRAASAGGPHWDGFDCTDVLTEFRELRHPLIGCIWELPVLVHERAAWVRHVVEPERPDLDAYLGDVRPDGWVGGS